MNLTQIALGTIMIVGSMTVPVFAGATKPAPPPEPKVRFSGSLRDYAAIWAGFSGDNSKLFVLTEQLNENGRTQRLVLTLDTAKGNVIRSLPIKGLGNKGTISLDGTRLALTEYQQDPTIRDMKDGAVLVSLKGHQGEVTSLRFSADGNKIVTASADKTAKVWDVTTGKCLATLGGHSMAVASAEFSPDGHGVATGTIAGEIKIWNIDTAQCLMDLKGMSASSNPAVFSADGKAVAVPGLDTPTVWNLADKKLVQLFSGHQNWVRTVRFDPTGKRVVTAGLDTTVRVWDVETGKEQFQLPGHKKDVQIAAFSPDGRLVVTSGADLELTVWEIPEVK